MIIRARRDTNFTMISNVGLEDERLSFKAKGLLAYLLSKPDHWQISERHLASAGPDGRDSVRSGLQELETCGYLVRTKYRDNQGHFQHASFVYDEPQCTENPTTRVGKSNLGKLSPGKPNNIVSTDVVNTEREREDTGTDKPEPPPTNNNSPPPNLGFEQKPKRHEKQLIDGIIEQVKAHDMEPKQFRELVDNILTRYGKYELAKLNTDAGTRALRQAQDTALSLVGLGYRAPPDIDRILQSWRENDWRGDSMPNSNQLVEHAAKMQAGTVEYTRRESKSSTPQVIQVPASVGRFMQ